MCIKIKRAHCPVPTKARCTVASHSLTLQLHVHVRTASETNRARRGVVLGRLLTTRGARGAIDRPELSASYHCAPVDAPALAESVRICEPSLSAVSVFRCPSYSSRSHLPRRRMHRKICP